MIKQIEHAHARKLHEAIDAALQVVGEKYGVKIGTGGATFTATTLSCKVTVIAGDAGQNEALADVNPGWVKAYTQNWMFANLPKDGLGKTFKMNGATYTLVGFRPKARLQVVARKGNNKMFKALSVEAVVAAFK